MYSIDVHCTLYNIMYTVHCTTLMYMSHCKALVCTVRCTEYILHIRPALSPLTLTAELHSDSRSAPRPPAANTGSTAAVKQTLHNKLFSFVCGVPYPIMLERKKREMENKFLTRSPWKARGEENACTIPNSFQFVQLKKTLSRSLKYNGAIC